MRSEIRRFAGLTGRPLKDIARSVTNPRRLPADNAGNFLPRGDVAEISASPVDIDRMAIGELSDRIRIWAGLSSFGVSGSAGRALRAEEAHRADAVSAMR